MKVALLITVYVFTGYYCNAQLILKDIFSRNLNGQNIVLVDWEGYMANPAIRLTIEAPLGSAFPLTVNLTANGSRLYFDNPSNVGNAGPSKSITLNNSAPVSFYLSIFPDRSNGNENYVLAVNSITGVQTYNIAVLDQDSANPVIEYNIITDFSKDNPTYHFYSTLRYRTIVRQAADDWAFFIQNMQLDTVAANTELTYIWNDEFAGGRFVSNQNAYSGFLLYCYGGHVTPHRSGGGTSYFDFQKINGVNTRLRRSGDYLTEVHGNYNTLGYDTTITDDTWFQATNFGNVPNDLYSIAMHEMGHSLCFFPAYPQFQTYQNQGYINDPEVVAYQGTNVPVDASDHLSNGQTVDALKFVDRVSKKGAFGSEYAAFVPYGRWLITKLNLLCLKAMGYNIKQTSAFKNVNIVSAGTLSAGTLGQSYSADMIADGGIPFYKFEVSSGFLPAGLSLNSFTGNLSGTPAKIGNYSFTIRVTDYDNKQDEKAFALNINSVLPVKLTEFRAAKQASCLTEISFTTATENNALNFEIQKSLEVSNFLPLKVIPATGNASSYQFIDRNCNAGVVYYRLKLIDKDGLFTFSNTVSLNYNDNVLQLLKKGNIIEIKGCEPGSSIQIRIVDLQGRVADNQQKALYVNGTFIYNLSKLSAGIYTVIVTTNQHQKSLKIFIE